MLEVIKTNPELLKTLIKGFFLTVCFIFFLIALKFKWLGSFSISKNGIDARGVEKQHKSSTLNKLLDNQINSLDKELVGYARDTIGQLRRIMYQKLSKNIDCFATRMALVSVLRYPLYRACDNNDFKIQLRDENINYYIARIMKDIIIEYEDFALIQQTAVCPINNNDCRKIPALTAEIIDELQKLILQNWAFLIKRKVIDLFETKIKLYKQFIKSFTEIGDQIRIKDTEYYIEECRKYIAALERII